MLHIDFVWLDGRRQYLVTYFGEVLDKTFPSFSEAIDFSRNISKSRMRLPTESECGEVVAVRPDIKSGLTEQSQGNVRDIFTGYQICGVKRGDEFVRFFVVGPGSAYRFVFPTLTEAISGLRKIETNARKRLELRQPSETTYIQLDAERTD